ncbi:MAG: hypothetical protein K6T83_01560 [Alicyclobacillus sp.]|nr:hypothetical protein [Alicyclobacillus sp.]
MSVNKQRQRGMVIACLGLGGLLLGLMPMASVGAAPMRSGHSRASAGQNLDAAYQFDTNNYTQPDPAVRPIQSPPIPPSFHKIAENKLMTLYVNPVSAAIMVRDRRTGYVWTSVPPQRELAKEQLNSDWLASVQSPLLVNYFTPDAMMNTGSFRSLGGKVQAFRRIVNGFSCTLAMPKAEMSVDLVVHLTPTGLVVCMPSAGVKEHGVDKIASLQAYPFLGAVHEADVPGYMFIPDGSGALIRFETSHPNYSEPYTGQIYGDDLAIDSTSSANDGSAGGSTTGAGSSDTATSANPAGQAYMPVFGMVHGVNQNAFLAIVEQGKYNANIVAYPSGVNTNLNWVSAQFVLRNQYFQPTSENMGGFNTFQKNRLKTDMQVRYVFLSG